jgi:hypothetical protein
VAVGLGAWRLWPQKAQPGAASTSTAATGKPTLAVLYFENISGDPALNTWRTGLPELLITSLSQSHLLNVVSSESTISILKKLNRADARRFSAEELAGGGHSASEQQGDSRRKKTATRERQRFIHARGQESRSVRPGRGARPATPRILPRRVSPSELS